MSMESPFFTRRELAAFFGRSVRTVERWIAAGRLPCYRFADGRIMVRKSDVEEYMVHAYCPPRVKKVPRSKPPKPSPRSWVWRQNMTRHDGDFPANVPRDDLQGERENP